MIKRISDAGSGFGLEAAREITAEDIEVIEPQIRHEIAASHKHPIGILLDLSSVIDVEWKARWEELRFLHKYGGPIARVAVIGARKWEEVMEEVARATVLMQADIRYFLPSEIGHAWHWVKTSKFAEDLPVRPLLPPGHLMSGYCPEYTDL
jgi:hypothetical protein